MAFSIVAPNFLRDYVDLKDAANNAGKVRYIISPHSVDYVLMLSNPDVTRRMVEQTDPILYTMTYMGEEDEARFEENAKLLIEKYPIMTYYWPIRQMLMYILQHRKYTFDRRMLIMNHAVKVIDGMKEQFQQNLIPGFVTSVTETVDFEEVLKYFEGVPISALHALGDGVSFLKQMMAGVKKVAPETVAPQFKHIYERVFKGLGISGPETFPMLDPKKYIEKRNAFQKKYIEESPNIMENVMINYLWALAIPFTDADDSMWNNFVFYVNVYNALKILITTSEPESDEDLINIITQFDKALTAANSENVLFKRVIQSLKSNDTANNGDMAVITLS
jgi:hypothetical protein